MQCTCVMCFPNEHVYIMCAARGVCDAADLTVLIFSGMLQIRLKKLSAMMKEEAQRREGEKRKFAVPERAQEWGEPLESPGRAPQQSKPAASTACPSSAARSPSAAASVARAAPPALPNIDVLLARFVEIHKEVLQLRQKETAGVEVVPRMKPPAWRWFLEHVYQKYPPPYMAASELSHLKPSSIQTQGGTKAILRLLRATIRTYHPDKNSTHGDVWAVVAEEVTKISTHLYGEYKKVQTHRLYTPRGQGRSQRKT